MALVSRTVIGRGMARSIGQIAISVVATLIATSIYSGLRREVRTATDVASPSVTTGGKFAARIAGAELPPLPEPTPPVLSIVNWAITAPTPNRLVDDVAWSGSATGPVVNEAPRPGPASAKPARHLVRRPTIVATTSPALPPSRPADITATAPPPARAEPNPVWSAATATIGTLASFGGSAMALGTSTLSRLMP